jgi:hypothetical protein
MSKVNCTLAAVPEGDLAVTATVPRRRGLAASDRVVLIISDERALPNPLGR